ncbi:MAG TPA: phosphopantetheine-binding protein [Clostridia bacterium]|nr:phosphopantetheine-binding protein [Clostridia bacterium]
MIIDVVKKILVDQMGVESEITMETRLNEDLKFDSIDKAELITSLEDEFNVMVDYEEVLHVNSISEIVEEIKKYVKE